MYNLTNKHLYLYVILYKCLYSKICYYIFKFILKPFKKKKFTRKKRRSTITTSIKIINS